MAFSADLYHRQAESKGRRKLEACFRLKSSPVRFFCGEASQKKPLRLPVSPLLSA